MTALFREFDLYETQLEQSRSFRRVCYIMTMLLYDGVYFDFFENDIFDEKRAECFSEKNFFVETYSNLVGIFPSASSMFKEKKFLHE